MSFKVLLATDGSQHAMDAARFLAARPPADETQILMASIIQMPEVHHAIGSQFFRQRYVERCTAEIAQTFERSKELFPASLKKSIRTVTQEGDPGEEIVKIARAHGIDLIIMGALGESLVDRILLGSTGEFVAAHAPCSVLVVRSHPSPEEKWLFGHDGSEQSVHAFDEVCDSGWASGAELEISQVVPAPPSLLTQEDRIIVERELSREAQVSLDKLMHHGSRRGVGVTTSVLEGNHVGHALCQRAERSPSSVIVLGNTGKGVFARFLMGSVTNYVLHHAPCSVWISRIPGA